MPCFGAAITLAGLWRHVCIDMQKKFCQPLSEQRNRLDKLTNDLNMAQARRAAAHHYVDRLNVHLELARANSIALSQSLDNRLQQQLIFQQTQQRMALLAMTSQQSATGHLLKLASQAEQGWQGNTDTAELQHMQTANVAVDFYLTEMAALAADMLSTMASKALQPLQSESPLLPAQNVTYDLRVCVHDAITLLQPYLATGKSKTEHEIWPVYAASCPLEFYGDGELVRRTVYHYLLAMLDDLADPPQTSWALTIKFTRTSETASQIEFQLEIDASTYQPDTQSKCHDSQQRRLLQLLSSCGGQLSDTGIFLHAEATTTLAKQEHGLTVRIYPRDEIQEIGLQSCLRGLSIKITQHATPDLCIIGLTADSAVNDITNGLDPATTVILLNNAHVYQKAGWHVLPIPLHHQALVDCIHLRSVRLRQAHILVVDDDKNARLFLSTLLRENGATVHEAADGVAALATATNESFDLIFMDIHMPRMNGLEATRQLRATLLRPLPIIALTAHVIDSERAAIIDAGMSAILIKPVDLLTLRQILHLWLKADSVRQYSTSEQHLVVMPVFDTQLALQIANQRPQLAIEMLALFMQSLDADQKYLRQAQSENNPKQFSQQIHRLNGAARFCGIPRIQLLLQDIETQLKTRTTPEGTPEDSPEDRLADEFAAELTNSVRQLHIEFDTLRNWYQTTANPLATTAKNDPSAL
jgi:CheY-like chemotaxis protein/HPt (histidine-containing phosphotransfer) domain-containing protein